MTRYSPNNLGSRFARWTGQGVGAYIIERRMPRALALCHDTALPTATIARRVGYDDPLYFSRAFRKYHGRSPTEARSEGPPVDDRRCEVKLTTPRS